MENRHELESLMRAQVLKIDVRNHFAREIAVALDAEDLIFEIDQAAAIETQLPEPARAVEQVEMRQSGEGGAQAGHAVTGLEKRQVVGFAVIGDQRVELRQALG